MSKLLPDAFNVWWPQQSVLTRTLLTLVGYAGSIAYFTGIILFQLTLMTQEHEPYTVWLGAFYGVTLISAIVYLVYLENKD